MSSEDADIDSKSVDEILEEIVDKAGFSIGAFSVDRLLILLYTYVITTAISATVFGYLSVFRRGQSFIGSLTGFISVGNERTIPRLEKQDQVNIIFFSYILSVIIAFLISYALFISQNRIISETLLNSSHKYSILIFSISLFPIYIIYNSASIFRSFRQIRMAMLITRIGLPLSILSGSVIAIYLLEDLTVSKIWIVYTSLLFLLATISIILLHRKTTLNLRPKYEIDVLKEYISYTFSVLFITIFGALNRNIVFIVMAIFLSPISAGLFSLSVAIGQICRWSLNGVNQIFPAISTKLYEEEQGEKLDYLFKKTSLIATFVSSPILILVISNYTEILVLFSNNFLSSAIILPIIILSQFSAVMAGSVGLLLLMTDNERLSVLLHALHAIFILPIIIFMTMKYGVIGLAVAYFISVTFNNLTEIILLYRLEKLSPFTISHLYISVCVLISLLIINYIGQFTGTINSVLFSIIITILYTYIVYKFILDKIDRTAIKSFIK